MNNLITDFKNLEGLTILEANYDNCGELILQFTDGSVAVVKGGIDNYDEAPEIELKSLNRLTTERDDEVLQRIYSPSEWNVFITARRLNDESDQKLADERQLKYLKKKYPEEFKQGETP